MLGLNGLAEAISTKDKLNKDKLREKVVHTAQQASKASLTALNYVSGFVKGFFGSK